MATTGRKPKPAAIKELSGRDHHKKQPKAIVLDIDRNNPGEYMYIPDGETLWNNLSSAGVVKVSDRLAFMRYIDLLHVYRIACEDVAERGLTLYKNTVNECYNPSWRIMRDAQAELLRLEAEFGLTPSSKRRVLQPLEIKQEDGDDYGTMRQNQRQEREANRK